MFSHIVQMWQTKQMQDLNNFPPGELEETTRTPSYYVDEDFQARPKMQQHLPEWSNWRDSESSTLQTYGYIWRYALLVVLAIKEEEMNRLVGHTASIPCVVSD